MKNKNILFITPEFFGIEKSLMAAMEEKGYSVFWYDERSIRSSFCRAVNSISSRFFESQSNFYYKKIISNINYQVDQILIVKGDMVTPKTIERFREKFPHAKITLYLWDPVANIPGILNKVSLYDRVISFEPKDCKKYGFEFRPLFCDLENKTVLGKQNDNEKYDICFYGTMYHDRFHIVHLMREYCKTHGMRFYSFCFLRGKFMGLYYFLTNKGFRELGKESISYKPKSSAEIADLIKSSRIILDVNDPYQEGLTIRTLETLACGKKMITTNPDIVNYDFFNKNNICVIKRDEVDIPSYFFNTKYESIPDSVLNRYTARGWVDDVIR